MGDLSCSLRLLISVDFGEVNHCGRLSATGGVGPLVVVECDSALGAGPSLGPDFPSVEIDAGIFQGPPEAFD